MPEAGSSPLSQSMEHSPNTPLPPARSPSQSPALSEQEMQALAASLEKMGLSPNLGPSPCSKKSDGHNDGHPCSDAERANCSESHDCQGDHDCSETTSSTAKPGFWQRLFTKGLYNTLDIAFDQVKKEPKTILMLGGCRQREFARHLALMLPASDITLVDPDPQQVQAAKEEVCCRFKFVTAAPEALPFDNGQFDLVIAHNLGEYTGEYAQNQPEGVCQELVRVTSRNRGNLMLSLPNKLALGLFGVLPGFDKGLSATGVEATATNAIAASRVKKLVKNIPGAQIGLEVHPLPWQWMVFNFS